MTLVWSKLSLRGEQAQLGCFTCLNLNVAIYSSSLFLLYQEKRGKIYTENNFQGLNYKGLYEKSNRPVPFQESHFWHRPESSGTLHAIVLHCALCFFSRLTWHRAVSVSVIMSYVKVVSWIIYSFLFPTHNSHLKTQDHSEQNYSSST